LQWEREVLKERWLCKSAFCLKNNRASASGGRTSEVEDDKSVRREKTRRKNLGLILMSIVQMLGREDSESEGEGGIWRLNRNG